ncbi:MAG: hypothetical protein M3296_02460 [Actinomycetota bacterium]|nr:hypothetical protein [Actinomycetota bacterium]
MASIFVLCVDMFCLRSSAVAAAVTFISIGVLVAPAASADVFNGRIAFSSFRVDPPAGEARTGDVFTINPAGTDLRRLTTNPADDAQADWSSDGKVIAYRIRKPNSRINFEVARMSAFGDGQRRLTDTPTGQASSQPSWFPDMSAILYRRSGPGLIASIWQMGPLGEDSQLRYDPPGAQWYPSLSPDMSTIVFATTTSSTGDTDRAIHTINRDGGTVQTLFDVVGAYDSAPAWSPDGALIAFQSDANVAGENPEGDMEIWTMNADGGDPRQLTHNALHDEGPVWSPDATMLAYSSGSDDAHLDIAIMTTTGAPVRTLTDYAGRDESPDWQAIPAPRTDRRCGDLAGTGAYDVRAAGHGLACHKALALARHWSAAERAGKRPSRIQGFDVDVSDFGGTLRVVLTHRGNHHDGGNGKLLAFLYQP